MDKVWNIIGIISTILSIIAALLALIQAWKSKKYANKARKYYDFFTSKNDLKQLSELILLHKKVITILENYCISRAIERIQGLDIDNDTRVLLQYISELKEHKSLISSDDPKGFDEFCLNIENQIDKFCANDGDLFMVARTLHRDITNLSSILFDVQNNKENKMLP